MISKITTLKKMLKQAKDFFDLTSAHISQRGKHQVRLEFIKNFENTLHNKQTIFQTLNERTLSLIDYNKKTILVCSSAYRNIVHFAPLLKRFKDAGYQIIQLSAVWKMDSCLYMFDDNPVLFVDDWAAENELVGTRYDIALLFYYIISHTKIDCILQDEWTGLPLYGFYTGWPLLEKIPPIYSMRHSLSTFYEMPYDMKEFLHKNLIKYFVWGRYHCDLFYTKSEKIIPSGYPKLDAYENIPKSNDHSIFIVGWHIFLNTQINITDIIIDFINNTDYRIVYKPHPDMTTHNLQQQIREIDSRALDMNRLVVKNRFANYANDIANCDFVISWGSNIVADALALDKPVCLLKSNYTEDPIYQKTPGRHFLLDEPCPTTKNILSHIERIKKVDIEIFRNGLLSNLFDSTDFIFNEIYNDLNCRNMRNLIL